MLNEESQFEYPKDLESAIVMHRNNSLHRNEEVHYMQQIGSTWRKVHTECSRIDEGTGRVRVNLL
jgi:hypothetical protein